MFYNLRSGKSLSSTSLQFTNPTSYCLYYNVRFFESVGVLFGLINAPAIFQIFMEHCVHVYMDQFIVPYVDDLLVFSKDFSSHIKHLQLILE